MPLHPYTQGLISSVPVIKHDAPKLESISGMVPDLMHVPAGCRFCERCIYATERCKTEQPELRDIGNGHLVRCFREVEK